MVGKTIFCTLITAFVLNVCAQAPIGAVVSTTDKEQKALDNLKGKISGTIVWSTSRAHSNHDIWIMNADGTNARALTNSPDNVDWFSRISPDGNKIIFVRSKMGWVNEMDAEIFDKWDLWMINTDGSEEKKIIENACWGTWRPSGDSIVYARGPKVFIKALSSDPETMIFDAEEVFGKKKVYAQQPEMSPDGKFLAITVRGTKRETGVYNREAKTWNSTGPGCEMSWYSDSRQLLRMNEGHGNGGTEVLKFSINDKGEPLIRFAGLTVPKEAMFMDLEGRRSHEYFPCIDQQKGEWMVWCATQYGHEHDMVDYEVYVWNTKTDKKKDPVRLTFHSGNDRWPDICVK
jgi:dipeptidyl aminopeptidase/acylaminoacyl peptidase